MKTNDINTLNLSVVRHRECNLYKTSTGHLVSTVFERTSEWSSIDVVVFNENLSRIAQAYSAKCDCSEHELHMRTALEEYLNSDELQSICKNFDQYSRPCGRIFKQKGN